MRLCNVIFCLLLVASNVTAQARGGAVHVRQIEDAIAKIRSDRTLNAKVPDAERLATLTKKINSQEVTEQLVANIISLLGSPGDPAVYWVAKSLGNLGPVAKAAIPRLLEMLPEADCVNGVITSANGIRYALIQMGVKPPAPPNCTPFAGV